MESIYSFIEQEQHLLWATAIVLFLGLVLVRWLKAIKNSGEIVNEFTDGRGYTDEDYTDLVNELHETKVRYDAQVSCNKPLATENARLKERIFILENEKNNVTAAREALFATVKKRDETIKDLKSDLEDAIAQRNKAENLYGALSTSYDLQIKEIEELNRKLANDTYTLNGTTDKKVEAVETKEEK